MKGLSANTIVICMEGLSAHTIIICMEGLSACGLRLTWRFTEKKTNDNIPNQIL